jgi:uncharacterized membrane protein (UPF0127 family)
MGREKVPYGEGMIFVFPDEEKRSFWMCNTLVDLDILYLDATGTVVDIQTMTAEAPRRRLETVPEYEERLTRYPSKAPAQFAVELCVGGADLAGVAVGDRIELDLKALNALVADERND